MKSSNLLAIDTSSDACSVALLSEGVPFYTQQVIPRAHARLLLPMIEALLTEAKISLTDIDVLAFGQGPGSFTGIRIACSVIQALGFGLQKPVVPVSTLRALAQQAYRTEGHTQVLATLDARMQEFYWGQFTLGPHSIMEKIGEEKRTAASEIPEYPLWKRVTGFASALDMAHIAEVEYALKGGISALEALPVYLREEVVQNPK